VSAATLHNLSVRTRPAGGAVADAVRSCPRGFPAGYRRIVLFVHGYNVPASAADASYKSFTDRLVQIYGVGNVLVLDLLTGFYCPGDVSLGPLSFASYPWEIATAKASATRLADFVATLSGPSGSFLDLDVVAHSLGCRVALETMLGLVPRLPGLRIRLNVVCLMAGAVPVDQLLPGGRLAPAAAIPAVVRHLVVLHSTGDSVLHYAFPPGELAAGEGFATALGRFGPPPQLGAEHWPVDQLDHNQYWIEDVPARLVANALALDVVRRVIGRRETRRRALPETSAIGARRVGVSAGN